MVGQFVHSILGFVVARSGYKQLACFRLVGNSNTTYVFGNLEMFLKDVGFGYFVVFG